MKYLILIFIFFIASCSSHHKILGSKLGWYVDKRNVKIIKDIQISNLQIREVRMDNSSCLQGYKHHIELNGPIGADSSSIIGSILEEINKNHKCKSSDGVRYVTDVYLNSNGGILSHGIKLGKIFRSYSSATIITDNQKCSSACAFAFVGGKFRKMEKNAHLMFHTPYYSQGYGGIVCSNRSQMKNLKTYFRQMLGLSAGNLLFERTMNYCSSNDGWVINKDAAQIYNIIN